MAVKKRAPAKKKRPPTKRKSKVSYAKNIELSEKIDKMERLKTLIELTDLAGKDGKYSWLGQQSERLKKELKALK